MGAMQISQRITEAQRLLAALRERCQAEENPSPLLQETIEAFSSTLRDLNSLGENVPLTASDAPGAPAVVQTVQGSRRVSGETPVLQRESGWLQTVIDNTLVSLAYLDLGFRFVAVNQAFVERSGYTRDQLVGVDYFALFPQSKNRGVFERVRATGITEQFRVTPFTVPNHPE